MGRCGSGRCPYRKLYPSTKIKDGHCFLGWNSTKTNQTKLVFGEGVKLMAKLVFGQQKWHELKLLIPCITAVRSSY